MLKVTKLIEVAPYYIICNLNNGEKRRLDILPLLEKNKHFDGVEKLNDSKVFQTAHIGLMGEVCWNDIILINNEIWDFDISPEFIYNNGLIISD